MRAREENNTKPFRSIFEFRFNIFRKISHYPPTIEFNSRIAQATYVHISNMSDGVKPAAGGKQKPKVAKKGDKRPGKHRERGKNGHKRTRRDIHDIDFYDFLKQVHPLCT